MLAVHLAKVLERNRTKPNEEGKFGVGLELRQLFDGLRIDLV
jgi:hypothetical protein